MAITDVLLILIVFMSVWNGLRKGFMLGVLELITWAGSFVLALFLYQYVALVFEKIAGAGILILPVSLICTLLIVRLIVAYISNQVLLNIPVEAHQAPVNKAFGALPGFVNGCIYAILVAILLLLVPLADGITADMQKSRLAGRATLIGQWMQNKMQPVFEKLTRNPGLITETEEHEESVKLPFTVKAPRHRPDLEAEMLILVNKERVKAGLRPLKADPEIATVALAHSADMFARGYFSHISPGGKDPFDRMKKGGIRFFTAGENLALAPTLAIAHEGLMNSPGHRANILHKPFGRLGIGILDGGMRGLMVTQNFRN